MSQFDLFTAPTLSIKKPEGRVKPLAQPKASQVKVEVEKDWTVKVKRVNSPVKEYSIPELPYEMFQEVKAELIHKTDPENRTKVSSSRDIVAYLKKIWNSEVTTREAIYAVYLTRNYFVAGWSMLGLGGRSMCPIDPASLFQRALLCNSSALVISHNHPSGSLIPSDSDLKLTRKLIEAGKAIEIRVMDHIIVNPKFIYHSMADEHTVNF